MKKVEDYITTIPNFPIEGVMFRDITSLLENGDGLHLAIEQMTELAKKFNPDIIAGTESRGFIFGTAIAYNLHKGFSMFRKKGKLPRKTIEESFDLEYGQATLEMHVDTIKPGQRVVIVDDLVATGGTLEACIKLVERVGGIVAGIVVLIDLKDLPWKEKLKGYELVSVLQYGGK